MKLRELIELHDPANTGEPNTEALSSALSLKEWRYNWEEIVAHIKKAWLVKWHCTDQDVGIALYLFDDEPFAVSSQKGRKYPEDFEFLSQEAADKVRSFLLSMLPKEELPIADLDFDCSSWENRAADG